jgi:hypothetical protein
MLPAFSDRMNALEPNNFDDTKHRVLTRDGDNAPSLFYSS